MRNPFGFWSKYQAVSSASENDRENEFSNDISSNPETNGLINGDSNSNEDVDLDLEKPEHRWPLQRRPRRYAPLGLFCIFFLGFVLLLVTFLLGMLIQSTIYSSNLPLPLTSSTSDTVLELGYERCVDPAVRHEWRSLSNKEKKAYIDAVQCLMKKPSRLGLDGSLYEDLPWIHSRTGKYVNSAAPFLAWHRYFIHSYEKAMQDDCGYEGVLAYWDWSLDWETISHSPLLSPTTGFGGTGTPNPNTTATLLPLIGPDGINTIGIGHCVTNGPFSHTTFSYLGDALLPHCFSRKVNDTISTPDDSGDQWRYHLRPEALEELMGTDDYEVLNLGVEDWQHNAIPNLIGGDFLFFTSPYDPLFYLHHTQLDRLWYIWQNEDLPNRLTQYRGAAEANSSMEAGLDDLMLMGGFVKDVRAGDVVDTRGGVLCYRY